ncbi:MAG: glutamine-hydrolyzing GMP synthase [Patescibacteria group bacterium]
MILILDFGSQFTHLIYQKIQRSGYECLVLPADTTIRETSQLKIDGIILSGSAKSVENDEIKFDWGWINMDTPVLGICYGHQLIAKKFGATLSKQNSEFGYSEVKVNKSNELFVNLPEKMQVWQSHNDSVISMPVDFHAVASSKYDKFSSLQHNSLPIYTVQFHPEVSHTTLGDQILLNFCKNICKIESAGKWSATHFISNFKNKVARDIDKKTILCALSGGLDSFTMTALLAKYLPKNQMKILYVDTGLMPDETMKECQEFCKIIGHDLVVIDASDRFFEKLKKVKKPAQKGKVIGELFIRIFEEYAQNNDITIFAQGTIWSDVVESGITKFSSQIKPHHNVGGLPKKINISIYEPLRKLFKDQVRQVAKGLKLPIWIVQRKVFPGPGYAIRVQGEVTRDKVKLVRKSNAILNEILANEKYANKIWMAFTILVEVPSLGVKGDEHVDNQFAIVVRIVESTNSMTANFSRRVMNILPKVSSRIVNETEIGRVIYDITDKPPATIEWQ